MQLLYAMMSDGPVVRFGFEEGPHRVRVVAAHRHPRDVHRAVADSLHREVLLGGLFAAAGELRDRATRSGLRHLPAGVRIDFGVEHQHVHVHAGAEHVIEAAEADVICPSVAADEPHAFTHQRIGQRHQIARIVGFEASDNPLHLGDALTLCHDAGLGGLVGLEDFRDDAPAELRLKSPRQFARVVQPLVDREPHAEAELRVVFEQRIRPRRSAPVAIRSVWRGRQIAAIYR